jgi:DNA-binding IclR family transcriptional regulator
MSDYRNTRVGKTNTVQAAPSEFSLSASRALRILSGFSNEQPELGLSEISRSLSLSKAAVSRFLNALLMHGYVERNPRTGKYRAGAEAARVGSLFLAGGQMRQTARPLMQGLVERLGFSSYLSALRNDRIVILACVEGPGPIKYSIPVGAELPVHSTATGHAALACMPPGKIDGILDRSGLPAKTGNTITKRTVLSRRLAQVRARGYSLNWEENTVGVASVAAAACDPNGGPLCILSLGFATSQVGRGRVASLGQEIKKAAAELADSLNAKGIHDVI